MFLGWATAVDDGATRLPIDSTRHLVHRDGDYHQATHVWLFAECTKELLLQLRAADKDSYGNMWDISSAGHISAGDTSLTTARRELNEELGVTLPASAFEYLFKYLDQSCTNNGSFINNEFADVYLVTTPEPIPRTAFTLQKSEVADVKYMHFKDYEAALLAHDPHYVPQSLDRGYHQLFDILRQRYEGDEQERVKSLKAKLSRYEPVKLAADVSSLSLGDRQALRNLVLAAQVIEKIFVEQVRLWFRLWM
ncbi:hypothetical protein CBR_g49119 [Chara braunii]|uniref:Nudix hydrolase domain-containing protein n=1 Tax=Chara braunii TaxID=69332 RepID=A0A388K4V7_CHABU|nr:hypothetical protein CBR_g49119 [Chara braunii]|eukprot:GBG65049.1 hypothetical protein CBR_g49119 [Chara braunii]